MEAKMTTISPTDRILEVLEEFEDAEHCTNANGRLSFYLTLPSGRAVACFMSRSGRIKVELRDALDGILTRVFYSGEGEMLALIRNEIERYCAHDDSWHTWGWCTRGMQTQVRCIQCGTIFHPGTWEPCDCEA